jgi:hypothetical protein
LTFDKRDLSTPAQAFRILDPKGLLRSFLRSKGIGFSELMVGDTCNEPVFVCTSYAANAKIFEKFIYIFDYARRGGIVIFLTPPLERLKRSWDPISGVISYTAPVRGHILNRTGLLPFRLKARRAVGHWVSVGHAVKKHPIFEGLPVNCLMGQDYQNVCARETIIGLESEGIVCSLSWDWIRNYLGPSNAWWGSDLAIVPYGRGKIILSTLQIIENLGKDPVADKIFYNMVNFADRSVQSLEPDEGQVKREVKRFMQKFEELTENANAE